MAIAIAGLCWFTLGCGLFDGDSQGAEPWSEPELQATIDAMAASIEATREASAPTAEAVPKPTEAPAVPVAAGTAPAGVLAGDLSDLDPNARWGDLYPAFTEPEQTCIKGELGESQLALVLEGPVFPGDQAQERERALLGCLGQETAAALFYGLFVTRMIPHAELAEENHACIRHLLADADAVALLTGLGPDPTPTQAEVLFGFFLGLAACVAETAAGDSAGSPVRDDAALWSFATGGWVNAAPAVAGGVVYVGSDDHRVYALDAATGSELWSFASGDAVNATPTVADGVMYVGSDDAYIYALDAATGTMLWSYDSGARVRNTLAVSDGRLYASTLVNGETRASALDASSGELLWTAQVPHAFDSESAPTVAGDMVYVPGAEYGVFHALDAATGEVAWTAAVGSYVESAPTVREGVVFLTMVNEAYALDEMTGAVIWSYGTERYPARDFPALVVNGVYYLAPDNYLHALDATTGALLWTYQADGPINAAPVVAGGAVFAATEAGQIFAVDTADGGELWTITLEGTGLQALTVADGVVYVESDLGVLAAVDAADGWLIGEYEKSYFWGLSNYTVHEGVLYFGAFPDGVKAYDAPQPR